MSADRRPHIGLKARRIKKLPYFSSDDEKKGEEEAFFGTDVSILQGETKSIIDDKNKREKKNNYDIFFIINLYDKVYWRNTFDRMKKLPIKIKEILDDYTIKVKLKRKDYEDFYYSLARARLFSIVIY